VISGPGKTIVAAGRALRSAGWRPGRWPRYITTHGELLEDHTRAAIEELFGVAPLDGYGATETGPIAHQCASRDLYHLIPATGLVECLDDDGSPTPPGCVGNLVMTNVWNTLTPTVRYRIEDRAAIADRPCRCGYAGPSLVSIDGRSWDWLWDGRGGRVAPQRLWLSHLLDQEFLAHVTLSRVRQDADGAVLIELRADLPPPAYEQCRQRAAAVFGNRLPVAVRAVAEFEIPPHRWRSVSSDYWAAHQ
jgi:phenylacetate-CoA ligase